MSLPPPDHWDASAYATNARFVSNLSAPVLALLSPRPSERILDLGCGDGAVTLTLPPASLGVDASPSMVRAARRRGVDASVADAHALAFDAAFDAVFSNAALHWMTRPDAVLAGVFRALVPGGRFVAEMGGHGNVAAVRTALVAVLGEQGVVTDLRDVWYFPSVDEQVGRLEEAGFRVEEVALLPRPTVLEVGMRAWLETLAGTVFAKVPVERRAVVRERVVEMLRPALMDADGVWTADYVRLRFKAVKPE